MSAPSRHTLRLLGEDLTWHWTVGTIGDLFEDAGVAKGPQSAYDAGGPVWWLVRPGLPTPRSGWRTAASTEARAAGRCRPAPA